jgi:hypothetical protein
VTRYKTMLSFAFRESRIDKRKQESFEGFGSRAEQRDWAIGSAIPGRLTRLED